MAVRGNFTFADPALQRAVADEAIAMAQIAAAERAAQTQAATQLQQSRSQERVARENAAEARALRQADIERLDRQFGQSLGFSREQLAQQKELETGRLAESTKFATEQEKGRARAEAYAELRRRLADPGFLGDVPPPTEFKATLGAFGFTPQQGDLLQGMYEQARKRAAQLAVESENAAKQLKKRIDALGTKGNIDTLDKIQADAAKGQYREYVSFDPDANTFLPRFRPPREDVVFGPQPAPTIGAAGGGPDTVQTIDQLRARLGSAPSINPFQASALREIQPVISAGMGVVPDVTEYLLSRILGGAAPPAPVAPPRPVTGSVLAPLDYTGPEYDYSRLFPAR